tara:strand:+ start:1596 stop:2024 length:429 start_codon:yes stop_codon:yes gene_type:complete
MARTNAQKHNWWIERNQIGIVKSSTSATTTFTSPSEVKEIRLYVSRNDWDFEASSGSGTTTLKNSDSPSFDKIYHIALTYYTIAKLFEIKASADEDPEILGFAQLWRAKYEDLVAKAKGTDNQGKLGSATSYVIIPSDGFLL